MSQSSGNMSLDLGRGLSLSLIIQLRARYSARGGIIWQVLSEDRADEITLVQLTGSSVRLDIALDGIGDFSLDAEDPRLNRDFCWMLVEIFRTSEDAQVASISINGESLAEKVIPFPIHRISGPQSIGSAVEGGKAASFKLGELIIRDRPLSPNERHALAKYFSGKWEIAANE